MDEPVISKSSTFDYVGIAVGPVIILLTPAVAIYGSIYYKQEGADLISTIALSAILVAICIYWTLNSRTQLTINSEGIYEKFLSGKQTFIGYDDIEKVGTYRGRNDQSIYMIYGAINYQKFVIELKNGKRLTFDAGSYDNYDEIKAAIYKYKLGIGA